MTFLDDLDYGEVFQKKCIQEIKSNPCYKFIKENKDGLYDIAFINKITGKSYLLECKSDRKSNFTGNIFLEISYQNSKTISKSIASHYAFEYRVDGKDFIAIVGREDIQNLKGEDTSGGDYNFSKGLLIPVFELTSFPNLKEFLKSEIDKESLWLKKVN